MSQTAPCCRGMGTQVPPLSKGAWGEVGAGFSLRPSLVWVSTDCFVQ